MNRLRAWWLSAWPIWTLAVFAALAAARSIPGVYARPALTAPILLMAPGSVTLGAFFSRRHRPRAMAFVCYAALLSAVWSAFASLILYACGISITANSTYWCLLVISAVLATVAEGRLVLGNPGRGRRAANKPMTMDQDLSEAEVAERAAPVASATWGYGLLAVVAGASLLAGGLYAYDHLPHPAPNGYTSIAWTDPHVTGDIAIGATGTELHFQIVHRQPHTTTFRLSATWLGRLSRPLAKPLILNIGPNRTFRGAVFIPALPDGCTYRIVVALTAPHQVDPLTRKPQIWSIDADVRDPGKSLKTCR